METENLDIKSYLQNKGCKIQQSGGELQIIASWRGGQKFSVSVNPRTGAFFDFVDASGGSFEKLNQLLGGGDIEYQTFSFQNTDFVDELKLPKIFDKSILDSLVKDYKYWEGRAISKKVLEEFRGGLAGENLPKFNKDHYLTPILNEKQELEGFSARYTGSNSYVKKQKLIGTKNNFVFPLYLNKQEILNSRTIYLCEGIGDLYSLFTCGIRNSIATFGLNLSKKLLAAIISLNPQKIIICENFDENNAGQNGANKIKNKLLNFFDESVVSITPPKRPFNDINEWLCAEGSDEILDFYSR